MNYTFHWYQAIRALPDLLWGALVTIEVAVLSMVIGITFGILLALGRNSKHRLLYGLSTAWVEGARNTPALFQIYMAYFGLGSLGIFVDSFPALLIGIFAGVALLLASIGIYGVVSYSVSQQTHHIGVRMALGAQASDILKMVLKQGLGVCVGGMAIGVLAALGLMRLLRSLLYEVGTNDLGTFTIVLGTLFVVALLASYIPARRATKVDPLVALRYD